MTEVIYNFAMSLDGFIAREDGRYDWLESFPADDAFDFPAFMDTVTGIIMGRSTYEAVRKDGKWDYGDYPCAIATTRDIEDLPTGCEIVDGDPELLVENLRLRGGGGRIWLLGGGDLARQFLDAGLLNTVEIALIPVVLGSGVTAFGGAQPDRWLDLIDAKALANGAMHLRYRVARQM